MKKHILAWAGIAVISLAARSGALAQTEEAPPAPIKHLAKCPDNVGDYIDSDATAPFVKKCLGAPTTENHNPDGRFVYLYSLQGGKLTLTFLFASDGSMIRLRAYKTN
ncbi:MAG: hypothetical protein Q8L66_12030 [Caulobacter sp.]|nr:hypothetical protein [Caulobacter sp.]